MLALGHRDEELWEYQAQRSAEGKVINHTTLSHGSSSTEPVQQAEGLQDLLCYPGLHPAGHLVRPWRYAEKEMSKLLCSRLHLWQLTTLAEVMSVPSLSDLSFGL